MPMAANHSLQHIDGATSAMGVRHPRIQKYGVPLAATGCNRDLCLLTVSLSPTRRLPSSRAPQRATTPPKRRRNYRTVRKRSSPESHYHCPLAAHGSAPPRPRRIDDAARCFNRCGLLKLALRRLACDCGACVPGLHRARQSQFERTLAWVYAAGFRHHQPRCSPTGYRCSSYSLLPPLSPHSVLHPLYLYPSVRTLYKASQIASAYWLSPLFADLAILRVALVRVRSAPF
jgi:hypothetical protein